MTMNTRFLPSLALLFHALFVGLPPAKAAEFELAGEFQFSLGYYTPPEHLKQLQDYAKKHTPAGQPVRHTKEIVEGFRRDSGIQIFTDTSLHHISRRDRAFRIYQRGTNWLVQLGAPGKEFTPFLEMALVEGGRIEVASWAGHTWQRELMEGPIPNAVSEPSGLPMLWMMFLSEPWLKVMTNQTNWPLHNARHKVQGRTPEAVQWIFHNGLPRLPERLNFITPNLRPQFTYAASGWTNIGNLTLPLGFRWESLDPQSTPPPTVVLHPLEAMNVTVHRVSAVCSRQELRTSAHGVTPTVAK